MTIGGLNYSEGLKYTADILGAEVAFSRFRDYSIFC